jgi:chaperonin GroES
MKNVAKLDLSKAHVIDTAPPRKVILEPTHDWVVIERVPVSDITTGGIVIPDTAGGADAKFDARVLAVGPGRRDSQGNLIPMSVKPGDIILSANFNSTRYGGQEHWVTRDTDIIAIAHRAPPAQSDLQ